MALGDAAAASRVGVGATVRGGSLSRQDRVAVRCPGKINLHLEVLGRRPDGYHELRTLFAPVGVYDELRLADAPEGQLELTVEPAGVVGTGGDNLVLRAARAAAAAWRCRNGARIHLCKHIPIAGGMGGGSADAAATLVGLTVLWGQRKRQGDLLRLAAELGSDVPYFLIAGVAWAVGRGTELRALADLPGWWLVLIPGDEPVATSEVYGALGRGPVGKIAASAVYDWVAGGGELPLSACRNDLEPTVVARWPSVGAKLEALRATDPRLALVSGSGGTVFGVYPTEVRAREAGESVARFRPLVAPLLSREGSLLRPSAVEEA
jgi:4-diphosphocytidyl-2-C-methyl-D-erythritol kinase